MNYAAMELHFNWNIERFEVGVPYHEINPSQTIEIKSICQCKIKAEID